MERYRRLEGEEGVVSSYLTAVREREDAGNKKRKN
jgi:hypothetical protein